MRNGGSMIFWIFLFMFLFGSGIFSVLLPLVIIVLVFAFLGNMFTKGNIEGKNSHSSWHNGYSTHNASYGNRNSRSMNYTSPSQQAMLNVFLRRFFSNNRLLQVIDDIDLRMSGSRYTSTTDLDVYQGGKYVCSLSEFGRRYPATYEQIIDRLLSFARNGEPEQKMHPQDIVIDTVVTEHKGTPASAQYDEPKPRESKKTKLVSAQDFIDEINRLNTNIVDETISNGLYETCALLKQIQELEKKFPDSRSKLEKLYEYYLPILIKILNQFDNLQSAKTDLNYEPTREKLTKTLGLINDAMKTIIASMTDQDFINLSADISTLEAVLQKDGYAGDIRMNDHKE